MKTRKVGFYWVRFKPDPDPEDWTIGHFNGGYLPWEVIATDGIFDDDAFAEIGPRITPLVAKS